MLYCFTECRGGLFKSGLFTNGRNQGYLLSASGGTDASRYFMSSAYDDDVGIVPWNWDKKFTGRANVDVLAGNKLRLQGNAAFIRDRIRLAQSAIEIDPFSQLVWGTPRNLNTPLMSGAARNGCKRQEAFLDRQIPAHTPRVGRCVEREIGRDDGT